MGGMSRWFGNLHCPRNGYPRQESPPVYGNEEKKQNTRCFCFTGIIIFHHVTFVPLASIGIVFTVTSK